MIRALAAAAIAGTVLAGAAPAGASACSTDVFAVEGSSLTVQLCPAPAGSSAAKAALVETFSVKGQPPLTRSVTVDVLPGADTSRTIDDAPLAKLGIGRSLHLTIAYKNGTARLEHALLVPGAIALK